MKRWTCLDCGRQFGRTGQSHVCEPATTVDRFFATRPADERRAFEAVVRHLRSVGPVLVEAVGVGILIKRSRTFAELRPRRDRLVLSVVLSRVAVHPRITRRMKATTHKVAHFVDLRRATEVDRFVRDLLTEAYVGSPV